MIVSQPIESERMFPKRPFAPFLFACGKPLGIRMSGEPRKKGAEKLGASLQFLLGLTSPGLKTGAIDGFPVPSKFFAYTGKLAVYNEFGVSKSACFPGW